MSNVKTNMKQPWMIRRVIYLITSAAMLALTAFGVITVEQGDEMLNTFMQVVLPTLSAVVSGMAATKTTQASDAGHGDVEIDKRLSVIENSLNSPQTVPAETLPDEEVETTQVVSPFEDTKYTPVYNV